jgi:glycosyltransferase involved in cell wall biosynthesis
MEAPRVLALLQLPPPAHGVAAVNDCVAKSDFLRSRFTLRVEGVQVAREIADIRKANLGKLARTLAICWRVGRALASFRPDLVYFTVPPDGPAFLLGCVLIAMSRASGHNVLLHLHGRGVAAAARGWRRPLYRWALGRGLVIVLATSEFADVRDFVEPERVRVLSNATADAAGGAIARSATDSSTIIFVSNLLLSKGPLILVDALRRLRDTGKTFRAKLAGAETAELTRLEIDTAIGLAALANCVEYVGPVHGTDKDRLLRGADILAVPTYRDAFPVIVLEGMCYSLAVVATQEGAIPEMIEDGVNGLLVAPRDIEALAAALEKLLSDTPLRESLGREARRRYDRDFRIEIFEKNLADIWHQALESPAHAAQTETP